ncbi:MAG: helix-turn-helix domain-containing protein [Pseudomonadota bacterium]
MSDEKKYSLWMGTEVCCRILGIDPVEMLRSADLEDLRQPNGEVRVTAAQYFDAWNALERLTDHPCHITFLGVTIARGPVIPTFFALTCAPNLETGLRRLSLYKSLLGPTQLRVFREHDLFWIEFHSADAALDVPSGLGALNLVYLVEAVRLATADHIIPASASLRGTKHERHDIAGHLGVMPEDGDFNAVAYTMADARRSFVSENPRLWSDFEADLHEQIEHQRTWSSVAAQVRATLIELFNMGRFGAEDVCYSLGMSRSTLQRSLRNEKTSFQVVLDKTRQELAIRYLTKSSLHINEIALLLAYRDPNSFSRAFRRWTGRAPYELRNETHNSC